MQRRDKAGGKLTKTQRRKALKRPNKAKVAGRRKPSVANATERFALLTRERDEALEQQSATSEVLRVISSSPTEIQPVLDAIATAAARLLDATDADIMLVEGHLLRNVARHGPDQIWPIGTTRAMNRDWVTGRAVVDRTTVQVRDLQAAQKEFPEGAAYAKEYGHRTTLATPLLREGDPIGVILIRRDYVRSFTDKQIALVNTFANQAVIAIENTRLLNELRESLQQQSATADVLKVISSSPATLDPVFSTMLAKATELCGASYSTLWLHEGDGFRTAAIHGDLPPAWIEHWRSAAMYRPDHGVPLARATEERQPIQVADMRTDPSYRQGDPLPVTGVEIAGIRTLLVVPMFKESQPVGAIAIYRKEVLPFTEKQIELVQNFAAQAVIAIENTRLLNELRESLQQQTATADVLKVISSSPGELTPVFDAILQNAVRICDAKFGHLWLREGDSLRIGGTHGAPDAFVAYLRDVPVFRPKPETGLGQLLRMKQLFHLADITALPTYGHRLREATIKLAGARSLVGVPMIKDDEVIGAIVIYRQEVRPFTDKQIELVQNFAAQAVIAIENARLLNELRERTNDLTESLENLRTTQDQLVQTQKLASLGQLTAGIAHEIKNPLNFVNNFSGLSAEMIDELRGALGDVDLTEKKRSEIAELMETLRGNLDKVVQHGKRADSIVKNMLLHSREGSGERRPIDVNALVEESLNLAYHGARADKQNFNIMVEQLLDPAAGKADLFPQEITRVLLNLISNGVYATAKKAQTNAESYKPILTASTKSLGDRVEIKIRDNGVGIPPDVKEKMFNPFFTTKAAGEGTGLGLSISHDIVVKQHSGSIEVDTELGGFTEIRVILPRVAVVL